MPHGWDVLAFELFEAQLEELTIEVEALQRASPLDFDTHPTTTLLLAVGRAIHDDVPRDPFAHEYALGKTLAEVGLSLRPRFKASMSHWRRVKNRLPQRRRLFFWAKSEKKEIIFAWLNSDDCLREAGGKRDVYVVFCEMLRAGDVPNTWKDLLEKSEDVPERGAG